MLAARTTQKLYAKHLRSLRTDKLLGEHDKNKLRLRSVSSIAEYNRCRDAYNASKGEITRRRRELQRIEERTALSLERALRSGDLEDPHTGVEVPTLRKNMRLIGSQLISLASVRANPTRGKTMAAKKRLTDAQVEKLYEKIECAEAAGNMAEAKRLSKLIRDDLMSSLRGSKARNNPTRGTMAAKKKSKKKSTRRGLLSKLRTAVSKVTGSKRKTRKKGKAVRHNPITTKGGRRLVAEGTQTEASALLRARERAKKAHKKMPYRFGNLAVPSAEWILHYGAGGSSGSSTKKSAGKSGRKAPITTIVDDWYTPTGMGSD